MNECTNERVHECTTTTLRYGPVVRLHLPLFKSPLVVTSQDAYAVGRCPRCTRRLTRRFERRRVDFDLFFKKSWFSIEDGGFNQINVHGAFLTYVSPFSLLCRCLRRGCRPRAVTL